MDSDRKQAGWDSVNLSDVELISGPGTLQWAPLREHFDIGAFGINAYVAASSGQDLVERHTEEVRQHEEAYIVLSGRAQFTLDGETTDAPTGTVVFVRDPAVERSAVATEPGTTVVAVGARPGVAYAPRPMGADLPGPRTWARWRLRRCDHGARTRARASSRPPDDPLSGRKLGGAGRQDRRGARPSPASRRSTRRAARAGKRGPGLRRAPRRLAIPSHLRDPRFPPKGGGSPRADRRQPGYPILPSSSP